VVAQLANTSVSGQGYRRFHRMQDCQYTLHPGKVGMSRLPRIHQHAIVPVSVCICSRRVTTLRSSRCGLVEVIRRAAGVLRSIGPVAGARVLIRCWLAYRVSAPVDCGRGSKMRVPSPDLQQYGYKARLTIQQMLQ
jgi:hypothetical protein